VGLCRGESGRLTRAYRKHDCGVLDASVIFTPAPLFGVFIIEPEPRHDERGFFARTWCHDEAGIHGIEAAWHQCNVSFNKHRGTVRGMHYQRAPHGEGKLVRVTQGAIYDVVLDLRPDSLTFGQYFALTLTARNRLALYIPPADVAHGFFTLDDDSEVFYQMSASYVPGSAAGVRWNDPAFNIEWPGPANVISARDASYPNFDVRTREMEGSARNTRFRSAFQ
jgi:dTDP-4-dehydrorhamnose 3,5-epimerase